MKKIDEYVLSGEDINVISHIACSIIMSLRLTDPWDYDIQLCFAKDFISALVTMRGVAYDCSFKMEKGINNRLSNSEFVDDLFALKERVFTVGCNLSKITVSARLSLVEENPKVKFGIKAYDIQLFELIEL